MDKGYIKVIGAYVSGIVNPEFKLLGYCDLDEFTIVVEVDKQPIDFDYVPSLDLGYFSVSASLSEEQRRIRVYLVHDGKKELICVRTNTKIKRVKTRIRGIIFAVAKNTKKFLKLAKFICVSIYKGIRLLWRDHHFLVPPSRFKYYYKKLKDKKRFYGRERLTYDMFNVNEYNKWIKENKEKIITDFDFEYNPLISICIPIYNISRELLSECLDSILNQTYQNFEICLVDDCSTNEETRDVLKEYHLKDNRIKVHYRKENGHISRTTNDALQMATGEYVGLMDNDDVLARTALYEVVKALNEDPTIDFIYTDEDKIDFDGRRCEPHFKSDYAPDTFFSSNYFCHFTVLRKSIVDEIGGYRVGYEGAQDYDLFLRFVEVGKNIKHIPKVLYHWRKVAGSTSADISNKGYAVERGRQAVEDALKRRNLDATVSIHPQVPYYIVNYNVRDNPKVSIIIPTRNYADVTRVCLESIYEKTTYKNFEIVLVNNNSDEQDTLDLFEEFKNKYDNFKVVDANYEFNYSKINNDGAKHCEGDYIVLLNNDTEIITPNWLEIMVGYASQDHIGAVGAKLYYPDDTVQHAGVALGVGGIAQHLFVGLDRKDFGPYGRLAVPFNYTAVTAACLMVSRKKFEEVKGLEEELSVTFNDVDFNIRLFKAGYYNINLMNVELYHHESKSRGLDTEGEKYKRFLMEIDFMKSRWGDFLDNDPMYNPNYSLIEPFRLERK